MDITVWEIAGNVVNMANMSELMPILIAVARFSETLSERGFLLLLIQSSTGGMLRMAKMKGRRREE